MTGRTTDEGEADASRTQRRSRSGPLSKREREVFELLAEGLSGAEIARRLVLSPETVRTHIRNAMAKLGASTRSQAVVLALRRREIAPRPDPEEEAARPSRAAEAARAGPEEVAAALAEAMDGLLSLWDVDAGWVYLADDGGLSLRQVVERKGEDTAGLPSSIALGEGALGRAALERRAQVLRTPGRDTGAMIVAPLLDSGRLIGVLGLEIRSSRPTGRQEQLLLQALAARIAELIATGGPRLGAGMVEALEGFRASWTATTRQT
jgi:DNA-binding CsgD family transcriptional regulator/putative methionine-R-sulfoxide reductase with GAF domain